MVLAASLEKTPTTWYFPTAVIGWLVRPTMISKSTVHATQLKRHYGCNIPLHIPDPLSTTRAAISSSSSAMVVLVLFSYRSSREDFVEMNRWWPRLKFRSGRIGLGSGLCNLRRINPLQSTRRVVPTRPMTFFDDFRRVDLDLFKNPERWVVHLRSSRITVPILSIQSSACQRNNSFAR